MDIETAQVDRAEGASSERLAAQLAHRLLEQLQIGLDADRRDVAALLAAQEVAGAADFEIAGGDTEARAEVGELAQRLQALCARGLGEHAIAGPPGDSSSASWFERPTRPRSW